MEPTEAPIDLYIYYLKVEDISTITATGKTYVTLQNVGARFWVQNGVDLLPGDTVKLMFHKANPNAPHP